MAPPFVLFTDLDGTLLDGRYRPGPAAAALARLERAAVPVVFCSSKTRAEQEPLRRRFGVVGPFVVENGSAVLVPPPCPDLPQRLGMGVHVLGLPADQVREGLRRALWRAGLEASGFSEMTASEVAGATGLSPVAAARARRREYSETLVGVRPEAAGRLAAALARSGLALASGGRLYTVTGALADKGAALRWLMARLRALHGVPGLLSVAVGDSENDVPMLAAADHAYLVARPDGRGPQGSAVERVERLEGVGPEGFAELVDRLLDEARPSGAGSLRR